MLAHPGGERPLLRTMQHLDAEIPRELGLTGLALLGGAPEVSMVDIITGTSRQRD